MNKIVLRGMNGSIPVHFLGALGVLEILAERVPIGGGERPRLCWEAGTWHPQIESPVQREKLLAVLDADRMAWEDSRLLRFSYPKVEKAGVKQFHGLRPAAAAWRGFLEEILEEGDMGAMRFAAALVCETATELLPTEKTPHPSDFVESRIDVAAPIERSALQTAFDFTSRNVQFLDQAEQIRKSLDSDLLSRALFSLNDDESAMTRSLGWGASSDAPYALYTPRRRADPAMEWLAFRGLPFFPVAGAGSRLSTSACQGRRKDGFFTWPLWSAAITQRVVRSLIRRPRLALLSATTRNALGISGVFRAKLTKGADGYSGVFSPTEPL